MPGRPDENRDAAREHHICQAPAGCGPPGGQQAEGAPLHVRLKLLVGHLHAALLHYMSVPAWEEPPSMAPATSTAEGDTPIHRGLQSQAVALAACCG